MLRFIKIIHWLEMHGVNRPKISDNEIRYKIGNKLGYTIIKKLKTIWHTKKQTQ